ncbi:2-hydroxyacid dehydrogenase, putative [Talaromyces stipitatus ATCC 10500]|uniref:2-hydroxyacid dehydrogenase, putative n=1 Tax=Talaromyces stipitatus (strain ATCC 10500 / CBS 375.48 / QM 6759 / NRRL 1006) TaxID=441959 RepID=B8LTH0_TALSN|nr:2-hydroxyacid dehydrogenase, putative [Talaromyces stipitatus ATCC 10500]EED23048.1 2-hydroxyacid dehydrogenase, putative [Talaromyces stipitatus ATCC 10500]
MIGWRNPKTENHILSLIGAFETATTMERLLITLPFQERTDIIDQIRTAFPNMRITYMRHDVPAREAFVKQEMDVPTGRTEASPHPFQRSWDRPRCKQTRLARFKHQHHQFSKRPVACCRGVVIGALLGQFRQLFAFKELQRSRTWRSVDIGNALLNLYGKTMAILGYGSIGRQVARVAQALGMKLIVHTSRKEETYHQAGMGEPDGTIPGVWFSGRTKEELHHFLSCGADVLVLSLPLTAGTRHIIGHEELKIMNAQNLAFLVNIARDSVLDHTALLQSLKNRPRNDGLLGAALDVTEPEPLPADSEV